MEDINKRPQLKVSYKEKIANNFEYIKRYGEWCINNTRFNRDTGWRKEMAEYYDLASGNLNMDWFKRVTNPYNFTKEKHKNQPAKIEYYNILFPILMALLGEKRARPFNATVTVEGEDVNNRKIAKRLELIAELVKQEVANVAAEAGEETEVSPKQIDPQKELEAFEASYKDEVAIQGQSVLDYVIARDRIREKIQEGFYHWLVTGEAYFFTEFRNNEMRNVPISPLHIDYDLDGESKFVEDSDWVVYRQYWSPSKILDHFYDELTEDQITKLDDRTGKYIFYDVFSDYYNLHYRNKRDLDRLAERDKVEVIHCQFRLFKKVGVLSYYNEVGEELEMEVDESYTLSRLDKQRGFKLRFIWVNEVWEGYRIDGGDYNIYDRKDGQHGFWLGIQPVPYQFNELNNKAECKLSYTGRRFLDIHSRPISMVKLAMPYVIMNIILWFRLEKAIAKSRGEMAVMFTESLPNGKNGFDMNDVLYYSEVLGIWLVSYTQMEQAGLAGQGLNNLVAKVNQSQMNDAQFYIQLLEKVWQDLQRMFGMYDQRLGTPKASEGIGQVNSAIIQASTVTEMIFYEFEQIEERLLANILEVSKVAFIEGKSAYFVQTDSDHMEYLSLDTENHLFADYQVFLTKAGKENQELEMLRQAAINLASQGNRPSVVAEMIQANNFSKIKQYLRDMEERDMQMAQQQAQSQQEAEANKIKIQQEFETLRQQLQGEREASNIQLQGQIDMAIEQMKLGANLPMDEPTNETITEAELLKYSADMSKQNQQNSIERDKLNLQKEKQNQDALLKVAEIKAKQAAEQLKARTALKNKTSGEK